MSANRHKYGLAIAAAMRDADVLNAIETGAPEQITFRVKLGLETYRGELDFGKPDTDRAWRLKVSNACFEDVLKRALARDDEEQAKVAQCPTCRAWFPKFAARNEHREAEHSASEQTILMVPNLTPSAGMREF